MNKIDINTLIAEVSNAVQGTQNALKRASIHEFMSYFREENDGKFTVHREKILLSYNECGEEKQSMIYVPTVSLVPHNPISLEKVEVTVKTNCCAYDEGLIMDLGTGMTEEKDVQEEGNPCEIKLVFQNKEVPEGMKEALEMINRCI